MNLKRLYEPFPTHDIEWRIAQTGVSNSKRWVKCLAYITARASQERLDEVFGLDGWETEVTETTSGILMRLGCHTESGAIWKTDGSHKTDIEPFKGGISGAFKRVASQWGIGRYLYNLTEMFAKDVSTTRKAGYIYAKAKGESFYWLPPDLPQWALPDVEKDVLEIITESQAIELQKLIDEREVKQIEFFNWLAVKNIKEIPSTQYTRAIEALKKKPVRKK